MTWLGIRKEHQMALATCKREATPLLGRGVFSSYFEFKIQIRKAYL